MITTKELAKLSERHDTVLLRKPGGHLENTYLYGLCQGYGGPLFLGTWLAYEGGLFVLNKSGVKVLIEPRGIRDGMNCKIKPAYRVEGRLLVLNTSGSACYRIYQIWHPHRGFEYICKL